MTTCSDVTVLVTVDIAELGSTAEELVGACEGYLGVKHHLLQKYNKFKRTETEKK